MHATRQRGGSRLSDAGVAFDLDETEGTITVFRSFETVISVPRLASPNVVYSEEFAPVIDGGEDASHAGADIWRYFNGSWSHSCTAGFMWEGSLGTGYATAGHCPNPAPGAGYTYADGNYSHATSPMVASHCGNDGDYEFVRFSSGSVANRFIDKTQSIPVYTIRARRRLLRRATNLENRPLE